MCSSAGWVSILAMMRMSSGSRERSSLTSAAERTKDWPAKSGWTSSRNGTTSFVGTPQRIRGHTLGGHTHALACPDRPTPHDLGDRRLVAGARDTQLGGPIGKQDAITDLKCGRHGRVSERQ